MTGSAQERDTINADLEAMMRAATVDFPEKAAVISGIASEMSSITGSLNAQAALCSDPPSMVDLLQAHDLVFTALRRCVLTMNDCSQGLVAVVQDFAHTDATAAHELAGLKRGLPALGIGQPPPQVPEPPAMADAGDIGAPGVTAR